MMLRMIQKILSVFIVKKNLSKKCHLLRHYNSCKEKIKYDVSCQEDNDEVLTKILEEKEIIIKQKNEEIERLKKECATKDQKIIELLEKHNEQIYKQNENMQKNMDGTQRALNTSVSALSYLTKKYTDAPALEPLNDYSALEEKHKFAKESMYYQKKQKLNEYLGGFIIVNYKKDDSSKQSIWNSDTVRLTYIIRESVNQNVSWSVDKKGIKVAKQIIDTMLIYVNTVMNEQLNYFGDLLNNTEEQHEKDEYVDNMMIISSIIHDIRTGDLKNNINKYIAPYFYLGKNENLIMDDNETK